MNGVEDAVDPLSGIMAGLRWTASAAGDLRLAEHETLSIADDSPGSHALHQVLSGATVIETPGGVVTARVGDLVLTRGPHRLVAGTDSEVFSVRLRLDASASATVLGLPCLVLACCLAAREPLVASLLTGMRAEAEGGRPGSASVLTALAAVVTAAAIRAWFESGCASDRESGLLLSRDPHIARAIAAMHADPAAPWTVAGLASVAQASRSSFAERFREVAGVPPLRYLTGLRMDRARELLSGGRLSVGEVATRLGYVSDAAFARAFRRATGAAPSLWREEALRTPQPGPGADLVSASGSSAR